MRIMAESTVISEPAAGETLRATPAYHDFGKGSGHPAGLKFGDCFGYALSRVTCQPLLYDGDDFANADVSCGLGFER